MALAPLLYNITFDSQTRILYFWDKAGHEIYHCEIPSPAPALPTVSITGDFGEDNWLYAWSGSVRAISVNDVEGLYEYNSGAYDTGVVYDSSNSYAVIEWYSNTYLTDKGVNGVITAVENNNYLSAKNTGSEGVRFHASRIAVCSSSSATVITVYDSSNVAYNAFKYTSDGTDYYYVLDGTQTDWTDDLSSIGYHVPPALPTVSMNGDFGENNYVLLDSMGQTIRINAGSSAYARKNGIIPYDETKSYGVIEFNYDGSKAGAIEVSVINGNGSMMIENVSSSSILIQNARIAVCSSPDATVITVYDSSNNPYNAFKYTSDGTDYYYVLDGTQTDWTDDLSSIGYHVPVLVTSYLTYLGASATTNFGLGVNSMYQLYDSSGSMLLYDSTKTYSIISANRINSQYPDWSSSDLQSLSIGHNSDYLYLVTGDNIPYHNEIYSVTYTVL